MMSTLLNVREIGIVKGLLEKEIQSISDAGRLEELNKLLQKLTRSMGNSLDTYSSKKARHTKTTSKKYRVWYKPIGMLNKMSCQYEEVTAEKAAEAVLIIENMHPGCKVSRACLVSK